MPNHRLYFLKWGSRKHIFLDMQRYKTYNINFNEKVYDILSYSTIIIIVTLHCLLMMPPSELKTISIPHENMYGILPYTILQQ